MAAAVEVRASLVRRKQLSCRLLELTGCGCASSLCGLMLINGCCIIQAVGILRELCYNDPSVITHLLPLIKRVLAFAIKVDGRNAMS